MNHGILEEPSRLRQLMYKPSKEHPAVDPTESCDLIFEGLDLQGDLDAMSDGACSSSGSSIYSDDREIPDGPEIDLSHGDVNLEDDLMPLLDDIGFN
mmetsp:Transcript_82544/g.129956  ORF Transcript_82544/g.129956 Transcript_82544/m.129956 type:complete len:97 (+) Transcript_82544:2196-2486(+)